MDVSRCLLLPLLLLHQATCDGEGEEVIGTVGKSVTFHLQSLDGKAVAWSFHNDVIVTVEIGNPPKPTFFDDNYKPRLAFPMTGSALTISQLRMDDSGAYTAKTSKAKTTFTLHVYRELVEPAVTCLEKNCSASGCYYTLRCTVWDSSNVSYAWDTGDGLWRKGSTVVVEEPSLGEELLPLTCMARNPVSSHNTTVISPAAICTESTAHPPSTGTYSSRQAGILAAAVMGALVLLAVVIFVIHCKSKGWRIFRLPAAEAVNREASPECMTVYAQIGPSQQVHPQSSSNAQRGEPNRMPTPGVETSKTIYSTIQAMAQLQTDDEKMGNGMPECQKESLSQPASMDSPSRAPVCP
ncbi:SLAM family member 7-like isoform X1 [Falco peregrinus]|uniref:SLAM family member 7-like isoform X1 n=1 Tax=Falco peregrinus TaxID=8954 RepID=UPI00067946C7|nr:SLAM family member 7-like isoform X1 [Falco peregrinus]